MAQRRKSKLYGMKVMQVAILPNYEYGVSHISKKTGFKFVQRVVGNKTVCIRLA